MQLFNKKEQEFLQKYLSAGLVSFKVWGKRKVLTDAEIKHPPAAQLSSTGTRSKWPPNQISVLLCQIRGRHSPSSPDSTGLLSADREACYCANCFFGELDRCWRIHCLWKKIIIKQGEKWPVTWLGNTKVIEVDWYVICLFLTSAERLCRTVLDNLWWPVTILLWPLLLAKDFWNC